MPVDGATADPNNEGVLVVAVEFPNSPVLDAAVVVELNPVNVGAVALVEDPNIPELDEVVVAVDPNKEPPTCFAPNNDGAPVDEVDVDPKSDGAVLVAFVVDPKRELVVVDPPGNKDAPVEAEPPNIDEAVVVVDGTEDPNRDEAVVVPGNEQFS